MSDVSPVDEQARVRVARAIFGEGKQALGIPERQTWEEAEIGLQVFFVGLADAALAAARLVSVQARERTPWTGRALFERFEHEAERGRGWPRLSKVGKHSWDALAEQIEGEVLAGPRGQDEQQLADAMTLLDRWLHKMGAVERENTRTMTEDFLAAAAVSPVPEDAGDERQPDVRPWSHEENARWGRAVLAARSLLLGVALWERTGGEHADWDGAARNIVKGVTGCLGWPPGGCACEGPDGVVCELLVGHSGLHLARLLRGYVEWEHAAVPSVAQARAPEDERLSVFTRTAELSRDRQKAAERRDVEFLLGLIRRDSSLPCDCNGDDMCKFHDDNARAEEILDSMAREIEWDDDEEPGGASTGTEDARDAVAEAHDYHLHDRTPMVIEAVAQALYRADEPSSANARAWACAAPKSRLYYLQRARESIEAMARPVTGTEEER